MSVDWQSKVLSPLMAAFGQPIIYSPVKGRYQNRYELTGIFDEAFTDINIVDGMTVTSISPCIGLNLRDLPVEPCQKDQILVKASFGAPLKDTWYIVKKVMPDGHGGCRLLLNVAPTPCDTTDDKGTQDQ
ncbi:head-tail joining protein [Acinetobacter higginsii]|uniref:head-tail joining protein n=1 Tax=Acinetobacter higginsii TaxID=70347 RepID=UPI001F4AAC82|nr:hypothetical protein [Acinetobacter higginsii]MCH7381375.1 hypothetical protein [Acinetobacter higginsii]